MRAPQGENFEALFLIPVALAGAFRGLARDIPPRSPADASRPIALVTPASVGLVIILGWM